ncbi:MAG: glycosyltransferase [Chloroflexota bacterium]
MTQAHTLTVLAIYTKSKNAPSPAILDQLTELRKLGITIDTVEIDRSDKKNYLRAARDVFAKNFSGQAYDVVHAYYGHCGLVGAMYRRAPMVITFQGSDLLGGKEDQMHRKDGMIGDLAIKFARGVIVMSEQMNRLSGRDDALTIPFGINTDIFYPRDQIEARQAMDLPSDKKLVLFPWDPSREEKNFHIAESAIEQVKATMDVEIVPIFGKTRHEVALYMNACDAMVLVSDHEGSPVAVREAMGCNLPVVSVDVGDVADLLDGVTPSAIVERDPAMVAEALGSILASSERSNGHAKMLKRDARWSAEQVLPLYQRLLKHGGQEQQLVSD